MAEASGRCRRGGNPSPYRCRRHRVSGGGVDAATRLHRDRYRAAEAIHLAEVDPRSRADVVIDNRDFARPRIC